MAHLLSRSIRILVPLAVAATAAGCFVPDIAIRHPMQRGLQQNQITKAHPMDERTHGLPPGALAEVASITEMSATRTCLGTQLNSLEPLDLTTAQCTLRISGGGELEFPQMWIDPPKSNTHQGLVPDTYFAGMVSYCAYWGRFGCRSWATRPRYLTRMVSGPVTVHTSTGQLCFPTGSRVATATRYLSLQLKVPRVGTGSTRDLSFTWELLGGTQ